MTSSQIWIRLWTLRYTANDFGGIDDADAWRRCMPAYLNSNNVLSLFQSSAKWLSGMATADLREQSARRITIGLVNNMPDGALEATERQFLSLLDAASGRLHVRLCLYSLPEICRKGSAASHVRTFYAGVENLWKTQLDGLIVTGREPLARNLVDEPYWNSFTRLVDWARENTFSTVWSCLAAHAAVLYSDGISRVRSRRKQCGIFECSRTRDHVLTTGVAPMFKLPHSRWNAVSESALKSGKYHVLARSAAGVDIFVKQHRSLFVFFQGHPEYEADTLMLEYRRDVARFLRGESKRYPSMPTDYFDEQTATILKAFQEEAVCCQRRELLSEVCGILLQAYPQTTWRQASIRMYGNWLQYIAARKELRMRAVRDISEMPNRSKQAVIAVSSLDAIPADTYAKGHSSVRDRPRRIATAR